MTPNEAMLPLCCLVAGAWCFVAACREEALVPAGGSTTAAETSGDPSETLGPTPDLQPWGTSTGDVEPEPIPCGTGTKVCGEPGDSLGRLDELAELSGCEVYRGSINLSGTETQGDLVPLSSLRVIADGLVVGTFSRLETLDGLECLERVGSLSLGGQRRLRDVSALGNLSLAPATAAPDGVLFVAGLDNLASLDGLQSITTASELHVAENAKLADLEGLSSLERVEQRIIISGNPLLTDLAGLRNLVDFDGQLYVAQSDELSSLDGLEQVHTLSSLEVVENPVLTNLDGLVGLEHVTGDVEFRDNPMLLPEEIDDLLAHVTVDGEVIIE